MMTAMARLPCKQTLPSQQSGVNSFGTRGYWDTQVMQPTQTAQTNQQPQLATTLYVRSNRHQGDYAGKRKSAVELLQESKAFYVKSETVLDRKQELKNSGHLQVSQLTAPGAPPRLLRKCSNAGTCTIQPTSPQLPTPLTPPCCWSNCHDQDRPDGLLSPQRSLPPPTLPPKSPRLVPVPQRRTISGPPSGNGSDQLQTKLRRLLNTDSKENVFFPDTAPPPSPLAQGNRVAAREDKFRYSPGGPASVSCREDDRNLHGVPLDICFKFGRSNSHSHSSGRSGKKSSNSSPAETTVCHKSLPDLHCTSTRSRASLSPHSSSKSSSKPSASGQQQTINNCPDCETSSDYSEHSFKRDASCYQRHIKRSLGSGGGDASSVLSSGGRTQKSSGSSKLSHGATARDSGGSSGHCTHRSEPPPRIQDCWSHIRRDSGASTQHSTEKDRSRKSSYESCTPQSMVRPYTPDSESSNSQTDFSPTRNSRFSDSWKEERGRPILRSKSDISDRYWRHDNIRSNKSTHPTRSVAQLEIFFDRLGLDSDNYHRITDPDSKSSSPVFFDSVSSVDSALGLYSWAGNNQTNQWQNNNCSIGRGGNDDCNQKPSDPPSIVERNARIIKWLCQCRKVQFGYS
ncbi:serine/arginine repetitive matrix protein 2 isoform X2 [Neodiprion virginianus]|uniref:serine/arginine repetitive matrix protein 2 isoform X2 n=1 Tax=Neodiprion virginianus TaxID=2961670 RepID=UPI001EE77264|nr:serine/arginine repetitive matrix protein 2 isoform X2 [Neodiprion virginianus]